MANKQKKKRNKQYRGNDAKITTPSVTRVSAVERNRLQEWWLQYGKLTKLASIAIGVIAAIVVMIIGIIGLVS